MTHYHLQTAKRLAEEYTEALKDLLGGALVSVVLFGSVARGEATPLSDIDLLVVAEDLPRGRFARLDRLRPAEDRLQSRLEDLWKEGILTDFQIVIRTRAEAAVVQPLYLDMVEDAVILYDRDGFFAAILTCLRESLGRLGARRLRRGRMRYWDLKPDYSPGEVFSI